MEQGRLEPAEANAREAVAMYRAVYGENHFMAAYGMSTLVRAIEKRGRLAEAATLQREVLAHYRRTAGDRHPSTVDAMIDLAALERRVRRFAQAENLYREALPVLDSLRPDRPVLAGPLIAFGELLIDTNRCNEAGPLLQRAVQLAMRESPANPERVTHGQKLIRRCSTATMPERSSSQP
jgi:hypothetical protein